jgi:hypothetical protein
MANDASLAAPLLAAAAKPAGAAAGAPAPASPSSRLLFLELSRVHPLLHLGVGLLVFAAQTALVCAAALLAALWPYLGWSTAVAAQFESDYSFNFLIPTNELSAPPTQPLPPLLTRVAPQLAAFALHAFTIGVASMLLEGHYVRCVSKPCLRATMRIAFVAGAASLLYACLLARHAPALSAVELGATLCTAAYSVMVRAQVRSACTHSRRLISTMRHARVC